MKVISLPNDTHLLYAYVDEIKKGVAEDLTDSFFGKKTIIEKGKNGEPIIKDSEYYISISHSRHLVICAVSLNPIGIDIEWKREINEKCYPFINSLYGHIMPVHNVDDWVKLEALVKLLKLKLINAYQSEIDISSVYFEDINIDDEYACVVCNKK
ncbi:hypothetical protein CLU96_0564 [Chryseobacterium sp. 52]|uniref:4'-phosphopantetheinyl transferase family protein n=1 Tax=Chryseobacterium sp. 52 TaxID=2035213 RepID=UPI000C19BA3E|nr:hypothetical protein [Chryseobacterium sp. 52]PIF43653.1 hypothetical protein CLU96_0564 [Chryseobacterium sp. 52]